MWLCHESIYQAVYQPGSGLLRPSRLAPHRRSPLRTGRDHWRAHQRTERRRARFEHPMLTIHQRPFPPEDRSQPGHWEGDLIIGKDQGSAIGTLVERQTRMVRLLHLPQRDGDTLHDALKARMADLPATLLRSITWDQGTEMPVTSRSPNRSVRRSTSATLAHPGSAALTKIPMGSCVTTSRLVLVTAMAWSGQLPVASRRTPGGLTRVLSAASAGSPWVCRLPGGRSRLDSTEA
jgi:hypothetical protein